MLEVVGAGRCLHRHQYAEYYNPIGDTCPHLANQFLYFTTSFKISHENSQCFKRINIRI
ncbi:unnamed protein product [Brassica oleracea]